MVFSTIERRATNIYFFLFLLIFSWACLWSFAKVNPNLNPSEKPVSLMLSNFFQFPCTHCQKKEEEKKKKPQNDRTKFRGRPAVPDAFAAVSSVLRHLRAIPRRENVRKRAEHELRSRSERGSHPGHRSVLRFETDGEKRNNPCKSVFRTVSVLGSRHLPGIAPPGGFPLHGMQSTF